MRASGILPAVLTLGAAGASRADDRNRVTTWVRMDGFTSTRNLDNTRGDGSIVLGLEDGKFGFRAEAAWLEPRSDAGRTTIRHHGFLVTGIDRGGDTWNVNTQAIVRYTPHGGEPRAADPLTAMVDAENAINYGQRHPVQFGFTTSLARNWLAQTRRAELPDAQRLTVAEEVHLGREASYFGQFKNNRTAFLEYPRFS